MPTRSLVLVLGLFLIGCGSTILAPADSGASGGGGGGDAADAGSIDAGCVYTGASADGLVPTESGPQQGVKVGDTWHWLGVPFAAPPVGALRWRPPARPSCEAAVRLAEMVGPICPQLDPDGGFLGNESCLTLDLWSKDGAADAGVMVFIHGGGNLTGSSSHNNGLFSGQDLATHSGVVVLAINYRLGALGYFAHPQLNGESDAGVSGNYGILDQQAALRWVRDNIRAFGGNPNQVMVFGESGGAQDTVIQLVAPGAKGLFKTAAIESGGIYKTTLADAITAMAPVVQASGCSSAADALICLRGVSAKQLATLPAVAGPLARGLRYGPAIDGVVIPDYPTTLMKQGKHNLAAVIIGTNADETSRMVANVQTVAEYEAAIQAQYGLALKAQILAQYPASRFTTPRKALIAATTDSSFTCGTRRIARALAAGQTQPVYRYFFSYQSPGPAGDLIGATHGAELPFVFGTFAALGVTTPVPAATALSELMQGYWTRLAKFDDPNTGAAAQWPAFTATGNDALELGNAGAGMVASVRASDCDFWDGLAGVE